ncbi:MAG: acetaldehyde dehydrogenase (acetylating) [Candidatus Coatesbacteria bacterium]|nr:MAG: acetaldehyde dehydrogenase (acetylating) [Candidatus Coatesbacteria bacterium]
MMNEDLQAIEEARDLVKRAKSAQKKLSQFTQEQVDKIVEAMAKAGERSAGELARLAVNETGIGVYEHKVQKNVFSTRDVYEYIREIKTCGILNIDVDKMMVEISAPVGVIAGIVPVTNPTSTTLYKALISVKSRNVVIFSAHPKAIKCTMRAVEIMSDAAVSSGAPVDTLTCLSIPRIEGTQELMRSEGIDLILATGGIAMVRAAYSSGKPAIGVGPGNVPVFIERTADVEKAVECIISSKTFDNGIICSSEQSIVVDRPLEDSVVKELEKRKAYFMTEDEIDRVSRTMIQSDGGMNPELVGKSAEFIARASGFNVPDDTTLLVARLAGVGRDYPLSCEKIAPVVAFYVEDGWVKGCERCIEILEYGGLGHTLVIHSKDADVIMEFGIKKPVFRVIVNGPGSQGAIGMGTGLPPAMTLGCGTWGGSATSDNITPEHLLQVKRLAFNQLEGWFPFAEGYRYKEAVRVKSGVDNIKLPNKSKEDVGRGGYDREEIENIVRRVLRERGLI